MCCHHCNSHGACKSFWSVDPLIDAPNPPLGPLDKRNVIRRAELFPHVAHYAKERPRADMELPTYLPVGLSSGKSPQYDNEGQGWARLAGVLISITISRFGSREDFK